MNTKTAVKEKPETKKDLIVDLGLNDKAIDEMEKLFLPLKISGPGDKDGFKKIEEYRKDVAAHRVAVGKAHKKEKAFYLEQGRKIDAEKNRLIARIQPIESHLIEQGDIVRNEEKRKKEKAARELEEKIQTRIKSLITCGAVFDGVNYNYGEKFVTPIDINSLPDENFNQLIERVISWATIKEREAKEEKERLAEEKKAREQMEAELAKKQAEIDKKEKEQAEREAKLKAEQDRIDQEKRDIENAEQLRKAKAAAAEAAENRAKEEKEKAEKARIEAEKKHAEEIEAAKKKAAADAKTEQERIAKEKAKNAEKERKAKERKARLAPDKEKLYNYANDLLSVVEPDLKNHESKEFFYPIRDKINALIAEIVERTQPE